MAFSKIILNGTTLMDATTATAVAADILSPKTAMLADGVMTTGTGSGGGGGLTTIASGTVVGDNNATSSTAGRQLINIGTKMAQTDFWIFIYAPNGSEFAYGSTRQYVYAFAYINHDFGAYDLSTAGSKSFVSVYSVDSNNGGTITTRNAADGFRFGKQMYNGSIADAAPNIVSIKRESDHFEILIGMSNSAYIFPSAITYNYEVVYFGSSPSTDIVEIS